MSFASLKKASGGKGFAELREKIKAQAKPSYGDDRFWKLTVDKEGVGSATFRFLPTTEGEAEPYVTKYGHSFKNEATNKWFIELCHTTIGESCPVCDANTELWETGLKANQDIVRVRKRKKTYVSNIYMVNDPANPENNGKVFLFEYGPSIFEMIQGAINPKYDDVEPVNIFDFWAGANFRLRAFNDHSKGGMRSYADSEFLAPSQLLESDEAMEAVWNSQYKLQELVDPSKFKPYAEVQAWFNKVIGLKVDDDNDHTSPAPTASTQKAYEQPKFGNTVKTVEQHEADLEEAGTFSTPAPTEEKVSTPPPADDDPLARYKAMLG